MAPDDLNLYPDAAQRVMTLMQNTFGPAGQVFNAYYLGLPDNVIIPQDAFPCVIVDKTGGTFKVGPTSGDDITEEIYIHILVDVKTGFGAPDTDNYVKRQLQTIVEGRDPTTGALKTDSVMYALRKNLTLSSPAAANLVTINNDINISYDAPIRPNMPETRECVVTINVTERQIIGVRS